MGNPCHPRSASHLHHKSVENKLWGRKCGDSLEIILAQLCRLIGGVEMLCSLENAAMTHCHSFHHPPVICFYDLIALLIGPGTFQLLSPLSYPQLVAGAIPSTSFDWSAVSRTVHLSLRNTDVYLYCYNTLSLFISDTVLYLWFLIDVPTLLSTKTYLTFQGLDIMVAHIYHRFKVLCTSYAAPNPSPAALLS